MYTSIIVTGSISYDTIMTFPSRFQDVIDVKNIDKLNVSFVSPTMEKRFGGTATNVAYSLSLLCPQKVKILGAVGKDGDELLQFYRNNKLSTASIVKDKKMYCANGTVVTDTNGNQVWSFYYGASEKSSTLSVQPYVQSNNLLMILANHQKSFLHFQNEAISLGMEYSYDPGMSLGWLKTADLAHGVQHATYVCGNDYEMTQVLARLNMSEQQLVHTGTSIVRTLGNKGVHYRDTSGLYVVPAYPNTRVLDPTGGGDAWRAGFFAGLACDLPIIECLVQANALASFAVECTGASNHKPKLEKIQRRANTIKKLL